jgi:hypothetical protein
MASQGRVTGNVRDVWVSSFLVLLPRLKLYAPGNLLIVISQPFPSAISAGAETSVELRVELSRDTNGVEAEYAKTTKTQDEADEKV